MWDLNRAERRALSASALLIGLAALSRVAWAPAAADVEWRNLSDPGDGGSPRDAVAAVVAREARAQTPLAPGERIDVSTASAEELRRLPGVGPSLADAILRDRERRPFNSVADLERVPGIGPATLARLADRIAVTGRGSPAPASSASTTCGEERVDLNVADAARLETLPGVGPALAARILTHRTTNGRFEGPGDLERVSGIGRATVSRLAPLVCVG